jgi:hypothetical protein
LRNSCNLTIASSALQIALACLRPTARLYDKARKVMAEHTALGDTVMRASEHGIKKLLDDVSPGPLRLIEWSSIETVVSRAEK